MSVRTTAFIFSILLFLFSCERLALFTSEKKRPSKEQTPLQLEANQYFWQQYHAGAYDSIPEVINRLTAAYLENPNDFLTTAHLGFTHMWALSERSRKPLNPEITNHAVLAQKYFKEAYQLNPSDARVHGFLASTYLAEGKIDKDDRKTVEGYFMMKRAIQQWPEFNYFTGGYVLSQLPKDHPRFKEALEWQWKNLDVCACEKVDRKTVAYAQYLPQETKTGEKRACWNSWIAPHNFEGFFLNMGDMLVKNGDWETAIKAYQNAKLSTTYQEWPYKEVLEKRIKNAKENVVHFNQPVLGDDDRTIMVNSSFSCTGCHQTKKL
ncbi:MAG: tetratricopeptide repeat protein [Rufibacter sp.]